MRESDTTRQRGVRALCGAFALLSAAAVTVAVVISVAVGVTVALAGLHAPPASAAVFVSSAPAVIVAESVVYEDGANGLVDREPAIDGDVVVWTRQSSAVLGHDLSAGTDFTVTDGAGAYNWTPAISGDIVVWITDTTDYELAAANISDPQNPVPITLDVTPCRKYRCDVSGDIIVWQDYRKLAPGAWGPSDIYGYDLATKTEFPIATTDESEYWPSISGTRVTWTAVGSGGYGEIHALDLATQQRSVLVAPSGATASYQRLDGDRLVWVDQRYGGPGFDVFARDLTTGEEHEVAVGAGDQSLADIHGDSVVYVDWPSDPSDATLYGYDLAGAGRFTLAETVSSDYWPAVGGDALSDIAVWVDERNEGGATGGDQDIYAARIGRFEVTRAPARDWVRTLATFDLTVTPPGAVFGADEMRFSADEVTWSAWQPIGPAAHTLPAGADGERRISVQLRVAGSTPEVLSEPARLTVGLDRVRPVPRAPYAARVKRGSYVTLKYRATDAKPSAGRVTMKLVVKTKSGRVLKRVALGTKTTGKTYGYRFRCRFKPGTYRFFVYATDSAGNRQLKAAANRLTVK